MSIRGFRLNISDKLRESQAVTFAQWIGSSNVMRNQKIREFKTFLREEKPDCLAQTYSHIRKKTELPFLKDIPVQLLRNASSMIYSDLVASQKGLRKFPKIKSKHKKRSVLITKELFLLESLSEKQTQLTIFNNATKKRQKLFSVTLPFAKAQLGAQFRISRQGTKFSLSGSYNDGLDVQNNEELLSDYKHLSEADLADKITGFDRGVIVPAYSSDGKQYGYSVEEVNAIKSTIAKRAKYQRILASKKRKNNNKNKHRCESNRQRRLQMKITKANNKLANIRLNFCHTASKKMVEDSRPIIALEDLKLKNMTRKAKPKRSGDGRKYLKNNGRAKSGLNRSMLNVSLGRLGTFVGYKAQDRGKAVVHVSPNNTSRECHICEQCNTIRPDQATLICLNGCGTFNADLSAGITIASRAVKVIKEFTFAEKAKTPKKVAIRKKKAVEPPLVCELASVKKPGTVEVAP